MWKIEDLRGHEAYLDSNVIIYAFEAAESAMLHELRSLFADIGAGATQARTSLIARAKVLVRPLRNRQNDLVRAYRELLSGRQDIAVQPLDMAIIDRAAQLRALHRSLRPFTCTPACSRDGRNPPPQASRLAPVGRSPQQ